MNKLTTKTIIITACIICGTILILNDFPWWAGLTVIGGIVTFDA